MILYLLIFIKIISITITFDLIEFLNFKLINLIAYYYKINQLYPFRGLNFIYLCY